jgi:hypothetical protein
MLRNALAMRVEENQVFAVASFLIGPNYIGQLNRDDYLGQSAILAPISLTDRGSGVLVQMGTNRTEGLISATLDFAALHSLWQTSNFRPRQQMVLANAGSVLAEVYDQGLSIDQSAARHAPVPSPESAEALIPAGAEPLLPPVAVVGPEPGIAPVVERAEGAAPEPRPVEPAPPPPAGQFERVDMAPDDEAEEA